MENRFALSWRLYWMCLELGEKLNWTKTKLIVFELFEINKKSSKPENFYSRHWLLSVIAIDWFLFEHFERFGLNIENLFGLHKNFELFRCSIIELQWTWSPINGTTQVMGFGALITVFAEIIIFTENTKIIDMQRDHKLDVNGGLISTVFGRDRMSSNKSLHN